MVPTVIEVNDEGKAVRNDTMSIEVMGRDPLEILIEQEAKKIDEKMGENFLDELGLLKTGSLAAIVIIATLP
jgi:hypothetical protein